MNRKHVTALLAALAIALLCALGPGCSRRQVEAIVPPLDNAPHAERQATLVGAGGGIVLHGKQALGVHSIDDEPWFEDVHVLANTPTIVWSASPPSNAAIHVYSSLVTIRYDGTDAGVVCTGGQCIATIRRYIAGVFRNGQFCRGGGLCSDAGLTTGIDTANDPPGDVPDAGPLAVCTAPLIWTGSALGIQVTCPSGVWVSGIMSGFHSKDPGAFGADASDTGPVDAGPDTADANGPDASDAGPAILIASVTPGSNNPIDGGFPGLAAATAGLTYSVTCQTAHCFDPGDTVAVGASAFLTPTAINPTLLYGPLPTSGTGTGPQVLTVKHTSGLTGTYPIEMVPSSGGCDSGTCTLSLLFQPDSLQGANGSAITGAGVYKDWSGASGNIGFLSAWQGSTAAPAVLTGGPGGLPYAQFVAASGNYLAGFTVLPVNLAQPVSLFLIASCSGYGGSFGLFGSGFGGGTAASNVYAYITTGGATLNVYAGSTASGSMSVPAAGPHLYEVLIAGGNVTAIVDETVIINNVAVGANNFGSASDFFTIGGFTSNGGGVAGYSTCNYGDVVLVAGNAAGALETTIKAALKARWSFP